MYITGLRLLLLRSGAERHFGEEGESVRALALKVNYLELDL